MKILVGYESSDVAREAVKIAITHARAFDAKVFVVTSLKGGPEVPRVDFETAESELTKIRRAINAADVSCESKLSVRGLEPGEDLVQFAEENEIDEIIVGVKKRSKVGKLLFGSTAQYVILEAPCPVVTVK